MLSSQLKILMPAIAALALALPVSADTVQWIDASSAGASASPGAWLFDGRDLFQDERDSALTTAIGDAAGGPSVLRVRLRLWDLGLHEFEVMDVDENVDVSLISDNPLTDSDNLVDVLRNGPWFGEYQESHLNFVEILTLPGRALTDSSRP